MEQIIAIVILVVLGLSFDFLNGFHDAANIVATLISSGGATPRVAISLAALGEFVGPFLIGVAVATTIGAEIVSPDSITIPVIFAALLAAISWNLFTWYFGLPSSSSHALIGGLVGAVWSAVGSDYIHAAGLVKVLGFLFGSLLLGVFCGYLTMKLTRLFSRSFSTKLNLFFKRIQIPTAMALALSHGSNDAQKTMGIITMGLVTLGFLEDFKVLWWVIVACAACVSAGTASGGWRIIKTIGGRLYRVRPIHAFSSQTASAMIIFTSTAMGGPVSSTNVISSTIMGVGSAERITMVRWGIVRNILIIWLVTLPMTAMVAALYYKFINWLV